MNIQQYLRDVTPLNVLDLLDPPLMDNLLNGYSFALGSGITVVYPTKLPAMMNTLGRRDALGLEARRAFYPLCACWRDHDECDREQVCIQADQLEVMKYFRQEWSGPRIYRCQPLGLWDMAFPLHIGTQIVGVLFGGQIIVDDAIENWQEVLRDHISIVDWSTCPSQDSQIRAVEQHIAGCDIPQEKSQKLLRILHTHFSHGHRKVEVKEFQKRIADFLRFGKTTQGLLDELHKARKTAAEYQLLRECDKELADIDLTDPVQWWGECGKLLDTLTALPEIKAVRLYVRSRSQYHCEVSRPLDLAASESLAARDVLSALSAGQLVAISDAENKELLGKIDRSQKNVWGFHSEIGTGREVCSTLVILSGIISGERHRFLADLCSVICTDVNLAHLVFRERDADGRYRRKVAFLGHSVRTPLQALLFELEDLEKAPAITASPEMLNVTRDGMARIRDTREDLQQLLEPAVQEVEVLDLIEVLRYVLRSMEPLAKKHPCSLVREGAWPEKIPVQGIRNRLQRALTCLLDNAIKYSYFGLRGDQDTLYEVRVWVTIEGGYAKTMMRNYGIGIPQHMLDAIRVYGVRGNVGDKKRVRPGTGLGLRIAIDDFEELGGWIHIASTPAKSATEEEKKAYHRYITTVEAALPIVGRK